MAWTKAKFERYAWMRDALEPLGFTPQEIDSLLRCSRVLSTWAMHECNGAIQRDDETDKPYWYSTATGERIGRTADREAGALARIKTLCDRHGVTFYHQGDPRGCALYVIRPGDIPEGQKVGAYYTRGVAVCVD